MVDGCNKSISGFAAGNISGLNDNSEAQRTASFFDQAVANFQGSRSPANSVQSGNLFPPPGGGETATALGGAVQINGPGAAQMAAELDQMVASSPSLQQFLSQGLSEGETVQIDIVNGSDTGSFSTLEAPGGQERIVIDLSQSQELGVSPSDIARSELFHALGNLPDGEVGVTPDLNDNVITVQEAQYMYAMDIGVNLPGPQAYSRPDDPAFWAFT
jgi:hypothetical protein